MMQGHDVDMKLGGGGTAGVAEILLHARHRPEYGQAVGLSHHRHEAALVLPAALALPDRRCSPPPAAWPLSATSTASSSAVDVKTGKTLWKTRLGTTVQGYPVSFSVDGKQYIAVTTGLGGGSPQQKPTMLLDEVHRPATGQMLYVFGLPD